MTSDKTVKIGIMSFAHMHAVNYAAALKCVPGAEFVGVADTVQDRANQMAEKFGVTAFPSLEAMLGSGVDAIIVTSENANHRRHVVTAAQNEKHVLCEKPLAGKKEDADAIVEVCKRSGVKLQTCFPCRFHPAYRKLKDTVRSGALGKVVSMKATNQGRCPGVGWFLDKKLAGGGAVTDHTVHVLDLMRDITGAEPVRVYAEISNGMFGKSLDDTGLLTIDFSNGVYATIDCSWSRPKSYPIWGNVKMDVIGINGLAKMDMFRQVIDEFSDETVRHEAVYYGDNPDAAMIASFVRAIQEDTEVVASGVDGAIAVHVVAAAYESSRTGKAVEINY